MERCWVPPKRWGSRLALALLAGYGENTWVHGVGDGAPWIAQQMGEVFPRCRYLLDRYHLLEHLYAGAEDLAANSPLKAKEWVSQQVAHIDAGKVTEVVAECRRRGGQSPEHPLSQLARYLENQRGHLGYAMAKEQGLPIGSPPQADGRWASPCDSSPTEVARDLVERQHHKPNAGFKDAARQWPVEPFLEPSLHPLLIAPGIYQQFAVSPRPVYTEESLIKAMGV